MITNNFAPYMSLTLSQQDIYFDQLHYPECPLYNVGGYIRLPRIDVDKLNNAHRYVVTGHDAFGIRLSSMNGQVCQSVVSGRSTELPLMDFSQQETPEHLAELWLNRLFATPIALDNNELFQAYLLKISEECYYYVGLTHHIVMDGWGFANWAEALGEQYRGEERQKKSLPWQQVVEADQTYIDSAKYIKDEDFWREQYQEFPAKFLPALHREKFAAGKVIPGNRKTLYISREVDQLFGETANQLGVAVAQLYLALITLYFSLAYEREQLTMGFPAHNRRNHSEKKMLGVFASISAIPLSIDLSSSLLDFCQQVKTKLRQSFKHQRFPTGHIKQRILTSSGPESLYDISFNYLDLHSHLDIEGQQADLIYLSHHCEQTPLKVTIWDHGSLQDVELQIDYNLAYFSDVEIAMFEPRLFSLMEQIIAKPNMLLSQMSVVGDEEKQFLIQEINQSSLLVTHQISIHALFEQQVICKGQQVAVIHQHSQLSYEQLNIKANQLARYLIAEYGEKNNGLIGIYLDRSLDMVIAMLAILKAGRGYVPLDVNYPQARIAFMVEDACLDIVITQEKLKEGLAINEELAICLDNAEIIDNLAGQSVADLALRCHLEQLAYVIYTSGSTGRPKGVMIEHRSVVSFLTWASSVYSSHQLARVLAATSICFDLFVFELFAPLTSGGSLQLVEDVLAIQNADFADEITLINTVPSAIESLLDAGAIPKGIKTINLAGEKLKQETVERLYALCPEVEVFDLYGPTEDTTYSTMSKRVPGGNSRIGQPIANTQVYILNQSMGLLPKGVIGELFLGGAGLARGYLNREQLTAEKFVENPFYEPSLPQSSERLYRTGDLVRWCEDDNLAYIGRIDDQVKVHGFRIELGEIESRVLMQPGVKNAVVIAQSQDENNVYLACFLELNSDIVDDGVIKKGQQFLDNVKQTLVTELPAYLVPTAFILLDKLPLTPNGKIDKKQLPKVNALESQEDIIKPNSATEVALRNLWALLLELIPEQISVTSNFFNLGGHSLLVAKLIQSGVEHYQFNLEVRDIFQAPTIRQLAKRLEEKSSAATSGFYRLEKFADNVQVPLSYAQYRIWFIEHLQGPSEQHNMPVLVTITREIKPHWLQLSIDNLIHRHSSLRSFVELHQGQPQQVLRKSCQLALDYHDLSLSAAGSQQDVIRALLQEHKSQCFDINSLPLFAVLLLKRASHDYLLQLNFHHLICDGWSIGLFLDELFACYMALESGENLQMKTQEKPFNYHDYALSQEQFLTSSASSQIEFWQQYLQGCNSTLPLPFPSLSNEKDDIQNQVFDHKLDVITRDCLQQLAQRHNGSLFNVIHTGLVVLLSRLSGQTDLNIGIPVTGRNIAGTQDMLGLFLNLLPLRSQVDVNAGFEQLLVEQIENVEGVLSNQDMPFERIIELSKQPRNRDSSPLFQVLLNMLSLPKILDDIEGVDIELAQINDASNKFDLTIYVANNCEGLQFYISYNKSLLSGAGIDLMMQQLMALLQQVAEDSSLACSDYGLCLLQHLDVAVGTNLTAPQLPVPQLSALSVPCAFKVIVNEMPLNIAMECSGRAWNYSQLDRISDHYAFSLQQQGLVQGQVVAIVVERSDALVIAILAVLKLGAIFTLVSEESPGGRTLKELDHVRAEFLLLLNREHLNNDVLSSGLTAKALPQLSVYSNLALALQENLLFKSVSAKQTAYIAFTSGSSGKPKAVVGQHSSLTAFIPGMVRQFSLKAEDRFAMLSGLVHDPLLRDVFTSLCLGATLCIPSDDLFHSVKLLDWLYEQQITSLNITPSLGGHLATFTGQKLSSLRYAFFSGEPLRVGDVRQIRQLAPQVQVVNLYGATETGRALAHYCVGDISEHSPAIEILPVGSGIEGVQLVVLNSRMKTCGIGEVGQIAIVSEYLPLGYYGGEQFTAEQDIDHPNKQQTQDRIYLTGDLGRYRLDGEVDCLGRTDQQIKVRGFRVELGEIVACLNQHPDVNQSALVPESDDNGDKKILAYAVVDEDIVGPDLVKRLRDYLSEQLPQYMQPAHISVLPRLPLTANGKLDTRKLRALATIENTQLPRIAAETETEQRLLEIWRSVFAREDIGVTDNFFSLGGHSLLTTRLLVKIQKQFSSELDYKTFFENSSIRAVGLCLDERIKINKVLTTKGAGVMRKNVLTL